MAVVYMTEDGYKKLADEIAQMEAVDRKAISAQKPETKAICLRMPNTMQLRKLRVCSK